MWDFYASRMLSEFIGLTANIELRRGFIYNINILIFSWHEFQIPKSLEMICYLIRRNKKK